MSNLQVGTIVRLKRVCYGNGSGSVGVCFQSVNPFGYSLKGPNCSIIFENGNHGEFTLDDQADFLTVIGQTQLVRIYANGEQAYFDYSKGLFDYIFTQYDRTFEQAKRLRILGGRHD